jgi:hypothetical protein
MGFLLEHCKQRAILFFGRTVTKKMVWPVVSVGSASEEVGKDVFTEIALPKFNLNKMLVMAKG